MSNSSPSLIGSTVLVVLGGWMLTARASSAVGAEHSAADHDVWRSLVTCKRRIPTPAPDHPGNVFLLGERVAVPVPAAARTPGMGWRVVDDGGAKVTEGVVPRHALRVKLGKLGVGWYRIEFADAGGKPAATTTAAVLAPLAEPVPQDSPVCVDSATAWFAAHYSPDEARHQEIFARLAALAGVNWIRDRMSWAQVEPTPGRFAARTAYDSSAAAEAAQGLKVLQVFHATPDWAVNRALDGDAAGKRFPRDLRVLYEFCKGVSKRFRGWVLAWEPWNEANITGFGGQTIDEMCSLQKAAYLGFKAGNSDSVVCWNVFAGSGTPLHTAGVLKNETWPYFETYNVHSYSVPSAYLSQHEGALQAASGRPLWITECGIRLPFATPAPWGDLSPADERRQAEFVAHSYASSLYAGVNRHFFFILGNYQEGRIQFGLLRHDHTPRLGYVALSTVGRLLAGARCLGRFIPHDSFAGHVYAFRSRPFGADHDVLVAWADKPTAWSPPGVVVEAAYDYLGRALSAQPPFTLHSAATFLVLSPGSSSRLGLQPPAQPAAWRVGAPSPVVLQLESPRSATRLGSQAHLVSIGRPASIPVHAYNFGNQRVTGVVAVESVPRGWGVLPRSVHVRLEPGEQTRLPFQVTIPSRNREAAHGAWVTLRGDFGAAGRPVLAFRLVGSLSQVQAKERRLIGSAADATRWEDNIVGGAVMSHVAAPAGAVRFDMQFGDTDPWAYPRLRLKDSEVPGNSMDGLALSVQLVSGTGVCRVQFVEDNGAAYLTDLEVNPDDRNPQRVVALFSQAHWGAFSPPDPDHKLEPARIRTVLVGINSKRNSTVRMVIRDLEWVAY